MMVLLDSLDISEEDAQKNMDEQDGEIAQMESDTEDDRANLDHIPVAKDAIHLEFDTGECDTDTDDAVVPDISTLSIQNDEYIAKEDHLDKGHHDLDVELCHQNPDQDLGYPDQAIDEVKVTDDEDAENGGQDTEACWEGVSETAPQQQLDSSQPYDVSEAQTMCACPPVSTFLIFFPHSGPFGHLDTLTKLLSLSLVLSLSFPLESFLHFGSFDLVFVSAFAVYFLFTCCVIGQGTSWLLLGHGIHT